jgi:hypothetical protein
VIIFWLQLVLIGNWSKVTFGNVGKGVCSYLGNITTA